MRKALVHNLDRYISKLQELRKKAILVDRTGPLILKSDPSAIAHKSARRFLLHCAIVNLLRRHVEHLVHPSCLALLTVPENWDLSEVKDALKTLLKEESKFKICIHPTAKRKSWDIDPAEFLSDGRIIVLAKFGSQVHEDFELAATVRDNLAIGEPRHLRALAHLRRCGDLTTNQIDLITRQPSERLEAIFRMGQPIKRSAERLAKEPAQVKSIDIPANLDISVGFGEAGEWASKLRADINDWRNGKLSWSELGTGCLLWGPPGTGKTRFAAALASVCDLNLEATSISRWQSSGDGALGDMLKALYRSFTAAKAAAPCLLFLDEIDSIGDRNKFPHRHADYSTQVVNALLECLDGIGGREGVIVVGACNRPQRIDPAILRSGRLEKHIYFPPPDAEGRARILAFYLPSLAGDAALREIAARLPGRTGADLELLSREARRIARHASRPVSIDDLQVEISPPPPLTAKQQFRVGIHEGGHAIVARALDVGAVERVQIFDNVSSFATETDSHGTTLIKFWTRAFDTGSDFIRQIAMHLAGAAAEDLYFGDRSTMSTRPENSDFLKATTIAAEMITKYGLGASTYYLPNSIDIHDGPGLWKDERLNREVQDILDTGYRQARDILLRMRDQLSDFAKILVEKKRLEGNELQALLSPSPGRSKDQGNDTVKDRSAVAST